MKNVKMDYCIISEYFDLEKNEYRMDYFIRGMNGEILKDEVREYQSFEEAVLDVQHLRLNLLQSGCVVIRGNGDPEKQATLPMIGMMIAHLPGIYVVNVQYESSDKESHREESFPYLSRRDADKFFNSVKKAYAGSRT